MYSGKKDWVEAYFDTIESNEHSQAELKRFASCRTYILGNWDSVQNRSRNGYVECSAEGHVSHVLSHRLSSRPIAWSKNGSETIANLRVYTRNGGSIRGLLENSKKLVIEDKAEVILDKKTLKRKNQGYAEFSTNSTILDIGIRTNLYKLFNALRTA